MQTVAMVAGMMLLSSLELGRFTRQDYFRWLWVIPVLLALFFNANVLHNSFGWDDRAVISGWANPVRPAGDQTSNFSEPPPKMLSSYYRPIISLSYLVDYKIWGTKPFGYHFSVWLGHLLNTVLIFFLARRLLSDGNHSSSFIPLVASSLFAVHPAHAEAVAWIAGRSDVFCTVFALASFLFYIEFRRKNVLIWLALSIGAYALALLTKEVAVGLVMLFPIYDAVRHPASASGRRWRIDPVWMIPILIITAYFGMRYLKILLPYGFSPADGRSFFSKAGEMITAYGFYLDRMIYPYPQLPFVATLPASFLFRVLSTLAILGLLSIGVYAVVQREVIPGTAVAWMLLALIPAAVIPIYGITATPAAERHLYAASAGFVILIGWIIQRTVERLQAATAWHSWNIWAGVGLILTSLLAVWGVESHQRNAVWQNTVTFWQAAVVSAPEAGLPNRELGKQYAELGRNLEAERYYLKALSIWEKQPGRDSSFTTTVLEDLGVLYSDQGRYAQAELLYQRSIGNLEKMRGPDDPTVAPDLHNLAKVYYAMGKYSEAEPLYRRALEIWEKALGPEHPIVAAELHSLAVLYHTQGRYGEAEPLYRKAIEIQERTFGPDNPDLAQTLLDLAALLHIQRKYAEAEELYGRSITIRERYYGEEHPLVAAGLANLAELYRVEGRDAQAEPLYRRVIAIQEKALGPDHPLVVNIRESYSSLLKKMGRADEAEKLEAQVKMIREKQAQKSAPVVKLR